VSYPSDIDGHFFEEDIRSLYDRGLTTVDPFRPDETLTRGQFAAYLNRLLEYLGDVLEPPVVEPPPDPEPEPVPPPSGGLPAEGGVITVTKDGTVIDGGFADSIIVKADGVSILNVDVGYEIATHGWDVQRLLIRGCRARRIWIDPFHGTGRGTRDIRIEYNDIYDCPSMGIGLVSYKDWEWIYDVEVVGNKIGPMAGGDDAVRVHKVDGFTFIKNEVFGVFEDGSHNDGIQTVHGGRNFYIKWNWFHDGRSQPIFVGKDGFGQPYENLEMSFNVVSDDAGPMHTQVWPFSGTVRVSHNTFINAEFSVRNISGHGGTFQGAQVFENTSVKWPEGVPAGVEEWNNVGGQGAGWDPTVARFGIEALP
jgi:hypothetical protein